MFTSDATNAITSVFGWIWSFINITIPGLTITLWQLAIGLFMFKVIWRIALSLTNTIGGGISYRSTSYHKNNDSTEHTYKYRDEKLASDPDYVYSIKKVREK